MSRPFCLHYFDNWSNHFAVIIIKLRNLRRRRKLELCHAYFLPLMLSSSAILQIIEGCGHVTPILPFLFRQAKQSDEEQYGEKTKVAAMARPLCPSYFVVILLICQFDSHFQPKCSGYFETFIWLCGYPNQFIQIHNFILNCPSFPVVHDLSLGCICCPTALFIVQLHFWRTNKSVFVRSSIIRCGG